MVVYKASFYIPEHDKLIYGVQSIIWGANQLQHWTWSNVRLTRSNILKIGKFFWIQKFLLLNACLKESQAKTKRRNMRQEFKITKKNILMHRKMRLTTRLNDKLNIKLCCQTDFNYKVVMIRRFKGSHNNTRVSCYFTSRLLLLHCFHERRSRRKSTAADIWTLR